VPYELKQTSPELKRRYGPVDKEYKKFTFQKEQLKHYPDAELFGPGHPLFESVVDQIIGRYANDVRSGAAFFDPDRKNESVVAFFRVPVHDGSGSTVGNRLVALEIPIGGQPEKVNPSLLIDCKPADSWESSGNPSLGDETALLRWGYEKVFRPYLDEMQARRNRDLSIAKHHVEISLNSLIVESQRKIMKYKKQLERGQDMAIAIAAEENRKRDLEERLMKRQKEIELEKNLSLARPELVGTALMLPMPHGAGAAGMARDEEVEAAAMQYVMEFEHKAARNPIDVSKENQGFDIKSSGPVKDIRYIEVKGRAAEGAVWLTPNEWQMASRFGTHYWLYVVFHAKTSPILKRIQNPSKSLLMIEEKRVVRYIVAVESIKRAAEK
jgi:hypothetical protein